MPQAARYEMSYISKLARSRAAAMLQGRERANRLLRCGRSAACRGQTPKTSLAIDRSRMCMSYVHVCPTAAL
jgi:hypothetical protein